MSKQQCSQINKHLPHHSSKMNNLEKKLQVRNDLIARYGPDFHNAQKCKAILDDLSAKRALLESELNVNSESTAVGKTVKEAQTVCTKIENYVESASEVVTEIKKNLKDVEDVRREVQIPVDKLHILQTTHQYLKVITRIESLSTELQGELKRKDDEQCVTIFANLCEISRNLSEFKGTNLRNYLKEVIHNWHNVLKEKLSKDFDEILLSIKWPFTSTNMNMQAITVHHIQRLQLVAEYLLQIELPLETIEPSSNFQSICLPLLLLIRPLKKRFMYHFYGSRQTNRNDKPEWYFTQILTWIRDHSEFVVQHIQPVIDKLGLHHIDAKLDFIKGLVQLAVEKLQTELPTLQFDDVTFSHCIDEALGFDKELRETYEYLSHEPNVLVVLTQAKFLLKWVNLEKKYATEKLDNIFSSTTVDPFELLTYDIEDLKVTVCADAFITLLQTITERYEALLQPGHRLQFLELQLELLDDFRIRLLQIAKVDRRHLEELKIPRIANTLFYVENVLNDWGSMLHFLNLYYYISQNDGNKRPVSPINPKDDFDLMGFVNETIFEESFSYLNLNFYKSQLQSNLEITNDEFIDTETVFENTLVLYRHLRQDLLLSLSGYVMLEIKSNAKMYRRERWSSMDLVKDIKTLSLTPSACPVFEIVAKRLRQLQKNLANRLFTLVWRTIASQLDTFLFEELVLDNRFNDGGSLQLKYDITRNLLPLFSQFSDKPEMYFIKLLEALNLLNLSKGSAFLLRDTLVALDGATGVEDTRGKALKEVGVESFKPQMALRVLNQRIDIVNRGYH